MPAGTPGVGKSRLCHEIAAKCDYNFLEVSAIAKKEGFVGDYDEQFECPELDEDAVSSKTPSPAIVSCLNFSHPQ